MSLYFILLLVLVNTIGMMAARMLLALYALDLGAQPVIVGTLAATFSVSPMLLSLAAGRFTDRYGARWPLFYGAAGSALGMLVPYFFSGMPALYIAAAMNGLSFTFFNVATQNLVGLLSDPAKRVGAYSNFSLIAALAALLGPLFAGFVIDHSGYAVACLHVAFLSMVPVLLLAVWGGALPPGSGDAAPAASVREAFAAPGMWKVLATSSLVISGIDLFNFYMPIYGHQLGLSASVIGVILGMFAAAGIVVRAGLTRLISRFSIESVLACSFYVGAAVFMLTPLLSNAAALAALALVFGLGMGCGQPITMMLTFTQSSEGRSGEALGARLTANHLTRVVGPIVFGAIGSAFGLFGVFWTSAALLASAGVLSRPNRSR